jgi:hypothetical protein
MMKVMRKEGICGYHLCTLNLEKSVRRVLEQLEWVTDESIANTKQSVIHFISFRFARQKLIFRNCL